MLIGNGQDTASQQQLYANNGGQSFKSSFVSNIENESANMNLASNDGGVAQVKVTTNNFKTRRDSFKSALEDINSKLENHYLK